MEQTFSSMKHGSHVCESISQLYKFLSDVFTVRPAH